jgi:hypothetical protein
MTRFKVGDILQVKDPGSVYSIYGHMFQSMGFINTEVNHGFAENTIVQVFCIDYHPHQRNQLCAVRDMRGNEALYDADGLQEIVFKRPEPKSIKVELTPEYTAEVFKDHIKVGCQTIYYSEFK